MVGGARLGRYQVRGLLARGGMAEILLAERAHAPSGSPQFAIKRILPRLADDAEMRQLFMDEAKLALVLEHSNIVRAFEIDESEHEPFLVMEFLHGVTLGRLIREAVKRERSMPISHAVSIVRAIASGLHHAHELHSASGEPLQLVHRDVSPNNVIVTFDGGVKLIDFGIAKSKQRVLATRTGGLRGTVPYMSPEQCRSEPLDRRSDVFSASIILWEFTVGQPLYPRGSELETLTSISKDDAPKPSSRVADFPPALEAIVQKGLARDREARFQTAGELVSAIDEFMSDSSATQLTTLGGYARDLFAEEAARPSLLAWARLKSQAPSEGEGTESLLSLPARSKRRRNFILGAAALLAALAAIALIRPWSHAPRSGTDVPHVPPPVIAAERSTVEPADTTPALASPTPAPAPAPAPAAARASIEKSAHKTPRKTRATAKSGTTKRKFNFDGPGLPE